MLLEVRLVRDCTLRRMPALSAGLLIERVLPEQVLNSLHCHY